MGFAINRREQRLMTPTGKRALRVGLRAAEALGSFPRAFCLGVSEHSYAAAESCPDGGGRR
jgi:hypothetical protein